MTHPPTSIKWPWIPFALLAIAIGLYPLVYILSASVNPGILHGKATIICQSPLYRLFFYTHISCGGIALLTGWSQFSTRLRDRHLTLHRRLGKIYLLAVGFSSVAGLVVALFADGGLLSATGFGLLALCWLFTAIQGYRAIRRLEITIHRQWMIRNYALTFAAVTLRIYLPLSTFVFHAPFVEAYRAISWLCWIPNLILVEILIRRVKPA
jgi:uncharacterized membrane protein